MKIKPADSKEWYKKDGDNTYRLNYDLNEKSIVVDLGARTGEWCDLIKQKYGCDVFCFEPIEEYYNVLANKKYNVFKFAITNKFDKINLGIFEDQASILYDKIDTNNIVMVNSIPAIEIFRLINNDKIDLLKINVEGAEYYILENLIDNNLIISINNIQVQFHIINEYENLYNKIKNNLEKTHELSWRFPFVWENWKLK